MTENEIYNKLQIATEAIRLVRNTAYDSIEDDPRLSFIDTILTKALEQIEEI